MTTLSKILCAFGFIAAILCSCTFDEPKKNSSQNEAELKSTIEAYTEAFNKKDYQKVASTWVEDAILHNPITDETVEGRTDIEDYYKRMFDAHKDDQLQMTIEKIVFTNSNEATVKSQFQVTDKGETKMSGRMAVDYVKEDGKWYIERFAEFEKLEAVSHFDKLEQFNWLVGDWVDESEGVEIHSKWDWDKHKNFLTEHFTMKVLDEDEFEGVQMIGWDPAKEKIRVWIFDSDGGFGEGTLAQQDHSWYASMVFTLPDGQTGSATNVYTKEDDNTYTFSSVGRDIEGTVLPNVGPYKIVKKSP